MSVMVISVAVWRPTHSAAAATAAPARRSVTRRQDAPPPGRRQGVLFQVALHPAQPLADHEDHPRQPGRGVDPDGGADALAPRRPDAARRRGAGRPRSRRVPPRQRQPAGRAEHGLPSRCEQRQRHEHGQQRQEAEQSAIRKVRSVEEDGGGRAERDRDGHDGQGQPGRVAGQRQQTIRLAPDAPGGRVGEEANNGQQQRDSDDGEQQQADGQAPQRVIAVPVRG